MKSINTICLLGMILFAPVSLFAQKDSVRLVCPFEHGSGREPKEPYTWQPRDEKIIMVSRIDSLVRSSVNGTVTNVNPAEDNKYEIVVNYKDLYFWYFGLDKPLVKRGDNVKAGQSIGICGLGAELEFRMFKDEQQMDPRNWLECKVPKADD